MAVNPVVSAIMKARRPKKYKGFDATQALDSPTPIQRRGIGDFPKQPKRASRWGNPTVSRKRYV